MIGRWNWLPPRMPKAPDVSSALAAPAPTMVMAAVASATRAARAVHLRMFPPRGLVFFTGGSGGSRPSCAALPGHSTGDVDHRSEFSLGSSRTICPVQKCRALLTQMKEHRRTVRTEVHAPSKWPVISETLNCDADRTQD